MATDIPLSTRSVPNYIFLCTYLAPCNAEQLTLVKTMFLRQPCDFFVVGFHNINQTKLHDQSSDKSERLFLRALTIIPTPTTDLVSLPEVTHNLIWDNSRGALPKTTATF